MEVIDIVNVKCGNTSEVLEVLENHTYVQGEMKERKGKERRGVE
jgi:hypothetical protein